jgi:phage tail-like protein
MSNELGFIYLNTANEWPLFEPHKLKIRTDGALTLDTANGAFVTKGVFRGGPFEVPADSTRWHRLRVYADSLAEADHVQLFTFTADSGDAGYDPTADDPFPAQAGWQAAPRNILDILILNPPARRLWIGGVLRSAGQESPVLHQMRVDYGRETYLKFLPAIYGREESRRDFLERFLSLHQSVLDGLEGNIADLPLLFDPFAVPDDEFPSWLSWLADWLAFDLNEAWSDAETRQYLAQAFQLYGKRGTIEGLQRYLKLYAGVEARIEEPGLETTLWSLGENSTLGFTTMLAPAHLQGAVVGTSTALDRSHITRGDDFGAALFEDRAHHFCVQVYCAELIRPGALEDVRAVIEREKPAHSTYDLCVIEPRMRIGAQARIGIDTIVAEGPPMAQIGRQLDTGVLAEEAEECGTKPRTPAGEPEPCQEEEI